MSLTRDMVIIGALSAAFTAGAYLEYVPFGLTETMGFITGALCVYLVIRENIWNFPIGIANNVVFLVLFTTEKLYGDAGLQIVYIGLAIHGWLIWARGGPHHSVRRVSNLAWHWWGALVAGCALATVLLQQTLQSAGGSAPFLDSLTTVLSLAAQLLLNYKILQNWWLWIVADILYVYLYLARSLHLTAILYGVFLLMCFAGWRQWRRVLQRQLVLNQSS